MNDKLGIYALRQPTFLTVKDQMESASAPNEPNYTDFVCGNRKEFRQHPGNVFVKRECVELRIVEYREAEKPKKEEINREIVLQVYARGGRFLSQKSINSPLECCSFPEARSKVAGLFRALLKKMRRSDETSDMVQDGTMPSSEADFSQIDGGRGANFRHFVSPTTTNLKKSVEHSNTAISQFSHNSASYVRKVEPQGLDETAVDVSLGDLPSCMSLSFSSSKHENDSARKGDLENFQSEFDLLGYELSIDTLDSSSNASNCTLDDVCLDKTERDKYSEEAFHATTELKGKR